MIRQVSALTGLVLCCLALQAADDAQSTLVKKKADEVAQAVMKEDYGKVADLTYPKIVETMGGREKMIALMETGMKRLKEQGIIFKSHTVGQASEFLTEGKNTFTVLPTTLEMAVPGGKLIGKSYLLGISPDGGKTWTFADGSGIDSQKSRDKLLPKLPAKLNLPEKQKPEFIKD